MELMQRVALAPSASSSAYLAVARLHMSATSCASKVADLRRSLEERGLPQYLSSWLGGVETTVHDASVALGHDIEIHADNAGLRDFFGMVLGAAEGWDGSAPLRPMGS